MRVITGLLILSAALAAGVVVAGQAGLLQGSVPADLGVRQGRLKGLSLTDNSVSSQASLYPDHPRHQSAQVAPLAVRGDGPATMARLQRVVQGMDGARVVTAAPDYLYVQYTSRLMKYVDDVEFWFDPGSHVIQVRSASRLGESDLGVNRQRIEAVRTALTVAP